MNRNRKRDVAIGIGVSMALALGACSGGGTKRKARAGVGERIAILANERTLDVDASLANVAVTLPAPQTNADWGQPGGSADKALGHLALAPTLKKIWEAKIDGTSGTRRLGGQPVVAGGRLYVIDSGSIVHAFDASTGRAAWHMPFGDIKKKRDISYGGGVSVDGEVVYATNGLGEIGAMRAGDGGSLWIERPAGPLRGGPAVALGSLYATTQDNQLIALNAGTGEVEWTKSAPVQLAAVFGNAPASIAQGTVVVGYSSGDLNAYRYENGRDLWSDALTRTSVSTSVGILSDIDAAAVIDRGRVFAIGQGGRMVSLELTTGQRIWEVAVGGRSTPSVVGDWVFVVTDDARLLCLARATGRVKWETQLDLYEGGKKAGNRLFWNGPILAGGRLVLVSTDGRLLSVAPETGVIAGEQQVGKSISLPPIVVQDMLYILEDDGRLTAWR